MRIATLICALALSACVGAEPKVSLGGETFTVEVADEPSERQLGLMFRDSMPADHGMLFIFEAEEPRSFWMKNCRFPLDIMYFNADGELINVQTATPCRTRECPGYPSAGPARYVLELNAGTAARLGLEPGAQLDLSGL